MDKENEILNILSEVTGQSVDFLKSNKDQRDLWDSFSKVEIVFALEDKLKKSFSQEQIAQLNTVNDVLKAI